MRFCLLLITFCCSVLLQAQSFIKNTQNRSLSFKEVQQQFADFKKKTDLKDVKHWKNFKRYEMDMVLHSNGSGEPAGFKDYIEEAIEVSESKQNQKSAASPWFPFGTNAVPSNFTGYMENGIGRVNCVAFHPTDTNTFYVGVAQGGLWKTTNGGASYTPLTDNLPITRISDITLDPNNSNIIYISVCDFAYIGKGLYLDGRKRHTHYGLGVYKSTDGGNTWNPTGLTFQLTNGDASLIKKVLVNPTNSNDLVACGVSGMYKSLNGGTTWTKQLDSLFWDMVQDPANPNVLYAASGWVKNANEGHAGIYKTTNFGITWALLNTGIPMQGSVQRIKLAIAPSNTNFVYALTCGIDEGFYSMYQTTNAGLNWTQKPAQLNILEHGLGNNMGGQGTYDLALCVNDTNENIIYTGGVNIWGSIDGGTSFKPITHWTLNYGVNTVHADIHSIDYQPGTNSIFVSCDGGIYKSNNITIHNWSGGWPTIWQNLSNGMQITSFYRISSSKNAVGRIAAGAQDNATFYFNGSNWSTIFGGDGMDNYLDPFDNQRIIGSSQFGNFYLSNNGGLSGNFLNTNFNWESSEWVAPIVADYKNPGVLYIGNENVTKSSDGGFSWIPLATILSNTTTMENTEISALAVSPANSNVIYAARRVRHENNLRGIVFTSNNGGQLFTNITNNLPDTLFYTGIETPPNNAQEVVVSMAGFAAGHKVYKSLNAGGSWTNITYNLPNVPVNCIKYIENSGQLIVATDLGLYYLNVGSAVWINYSLGLPNVITTDIEINEVLNKVYVSTFGRGIWETNLSMIIAQQPGLGLSDEVKRSQLNFSVFPSINNGAFSVQLENENLMGELSVIDVLGRLKYKQLLSQLTSEISLPLKPGAYYIKLEKDNMVAVKKIIVE